MFDYVFDLQMFAENEASVDTGDMEVAADEAGEQEEEKEPIPEELGGLLEEAAREVMAEVEEGEQEEDTGEVSKAEEESIVKKEAIPYARFKQ